MAALTDSRSAVVPAVIVGVCLVMGLSIGGYFVGRGAMRFRSDTRVVTVKGQIFGLDGGNESAPFSPTSTPVKRISTFEFELR